MIFQRTIDPDHTPTLGWKVENGIINTDNMVMVKEGTYPVVSFTQHSSGWTEDRPDLYDVIVVNNLSVAIEAEPVIVQPQNDWKL